MPDGPPPQQMRPGYTVPVDRGFLPRHDQERRNVSWNDDYDRAVLGVAGWLARLRANDKDSRKSYVDAATGRRDRAPARALDDHHGGFRAVRAAARALIDELGRDEILRRTEA